MKLLLNILLCAVLCAALLGCTQQSVPEEPDVTENVEAVVESTESTVLPEDYTFPAGTQLHGIDISSMSLDTAYEDISRKVADYTLAATINGKPITFTAKFLNLTCSEEALYTYAMALYTDQDTDDLAVINYNHSQASRHIEYAMNKPTKNADIFYNTETGLFELIPGVNGRHLDMDAAASSLFSAIDTLQSDVYIRVNEFIDKPPVSEKNGETQAALDKANTYLTTEITYNFTVDDDIESVTLSKDQILSMIDFDSKLNPSINSEKLRTFVDEVNKQYGEIGIEDSFITRSGAKTDLTVTYYAQALDTEALCEDILYYLEKGISCTRIPPQLEELTPDSVPYRGSYVEIDMTNQVLYLFKDNECLLETPIVTGKVYRHMNTPTGVYKVLAHRMHVVLQGFDYSTYVKYWMQFYRGYGMHDAWWRDEFGGNEYIYNGSHGCVNIPPENAEFIFNNIDVGYPVILYGGVSNDGPLQQSIVGTETYDISIYKTPFQLDAKTALGNGKLTYKSSNPSVASVSEDGLVTIKKVGSAVITVEYEGGKYYTGATMKVNINVDDPCGGKHTFGSWEITTEPTCVKGVQTRSCTFCDMEESKAVAAASSHTYGDWELITEPKCREGLERKTCTVCGHALNRPLPAEHTLRDWKVTTKPTCDEPGEHYRSCKRCDYEETEVLPALGHSFFDDKEFCANCDTPNPNWIPPTEPAKKDEEDE